MTDQFSVDINCWQTMLPSRYMTRLTSPNVKYRPLRCIVAGTSASKSRPARYRKRILPYVHHILCIVLSAQVTYIRHPQNAQQDTPMLCGCSQCDFPRGLYFPTVEQRYCRTCACWFNRACLEGLDCKVDTRPRTNLSPAFNNIQLDKEFLRTVATPISRGGSYGLVGNSRRFVEANSLLIESKTLGRLPHGWKDKLSQCAPTSDTDDVDVVHYRCPVCEKAVLC
jgi:hypothetical protein